MTVDTRRERPRDLPRIRQFAQNLVKTFFVDLSGHTHAVHHRTEMITRKEKLDNAGAHGTRRA